MRVVKSFRTFFRIQSHSERSSLFGILEIHSLVCPVHTEAEKALAFTEEILLLPLEEQSVTDTSLLINSVQVE